MHICRNYKQYYPLSVVYTPPLYNSKQTGKLHLDHWSGKLVPNANYRCCHLLNARSPTEIISVHWSRKLVTSYVHIIDARATLAIIPA